MSLIDATTLSLVQSGRLGKREPKTDRRTLQLTNYVNRTLLPDPPTSQNWLLHPQANYGAMLNDRLGDCVCAAKGHAIQVWTADATGVVFTPPDPTILAMYETVGHYVPGKPSTDNGCYMLDGLNYFRKHGIAGHKIAGYVAVPPGSTKLVQTAIQLFGILDIGLSLPISAQSQTVWDVPAGGATGDGQPGSWGGHDVVIMYYDPVQLICITWGRPLAMTWAFFNTYCDESYALLSPDWIRKNGQSVSGFKMAQLQDDLKQL